MYQKVYIFILSPKKHVEKINLQSQSNPVCFICGNWKAASKIYMQKN